MFFIHLFNTSSCGLNDLYSSVSMATALSSVSISDISIPAHFFISTWEYAKPSAENLSPAATRIGLTMLWRENFSRSKALSTARLASDVSSILLSGFCCASCQISSAIAVDLPVPGGPCRTARSLASTAFAIAWICDSLRELLSWDFFICSTRCSITSCVNLVAFEASNK